MSAVTVTKEIHFATRTRGRREIVDGPRPITDATNEGRVPRVARLMALAIRIEGLIKSGAVGDLAEAAAVGHVSRARMTQIANLLLLAPDIQLALLELPRVREGRDPIVETHLRRVAAEPCWGRQRAGWEALVEGRWKHCR
ncbi:MAG: hypothetical protein U0572_16120 [Phycisphaerales bacterium]